MILEDLIAWQKIHPMPIDDFISKINDILAQESEDKLTFIEQLTKKRNAIMTDLNKEVADLNVDWAKVKQILSEIVTALEAVVAAVPAGLIKNIVLGLIATLNLVIGMLPGDVPVPVPPVPAPKDKK